MIGEFQHIGNAVRDGVVVVPTNPGDVLTASHPGRGDDKAITVFDSSGIALQDLFLGKHLLETAKQLGAIQGQDSLIAHSTGPGWPCSAARELT